MRVSDWLYDVRHDLRYALRGLRARPGFTVAVVATLALGIGANAAIFAIVDRLLFRPPAMMRAPDRTHLVYEVTRQRGKEDFSNYLPYAEYVDLTRDTKSFDRISLFTSRKLAIGEGAGAREMQVGIVTTSFFDFFDAPPALGRYFTNAEDAPPAGANVAVLGYGMWQTAFGGRVDAVGSTMRIGSGVFKIVGVAPKGFVGMWGDEPPAVFIPSAAYASSLSMHLGKETWNASYRWTWSQTMARRKPNVPLATANADLTQAMRASYERQLVSSPRMTPLAIAQPRGMAGSILPERGPNATSIAKVARLISGMALLVLLIALANVANLLLSRALRRQREIAVRIALGIGRRRLFGQLLTESLLLAAAGGAAGLLLAQWGAGALRTMISKDAVSPSVVFDPRTALVAALAVLAAGVLTGLAPIAQTRRVDLTRDLKAGAREGTLHRSPLRVTLLLLQGALSVVLLVGAGLFVRSVRNVENVRLGYDVAPVLFVDLRMRDVKLDSARDVALRQQLLAAAQAAPEVSHASLGVTIPFWSSWSMSLTVAGIDSVQRLGRFSLNAVSPDYFATAGTRLIRGRAIEATDVATAPKVMVVGESMAKILWPGADPLGKCVKIGADTMPCTTVVGVAENIRSRSLEETNYFYYLPVAQFDARQAGVYVRTRADDATRVAAAVKARLQPLMPGSSYVTVTPLADIIGEETRSWRLGATMFVAFGALALVLASIGLYSVIAYNVAQRTREMGVRIALGAQTADVLRLVVGQGMQLAVAGIAAGALIALYAARWIQPLLFQEGARDPWVFSVVIAVLIAISLAATLVPARKAAGVDPGTALRAE